MRYRLEHKARMFGKIRWYEVDTFDRRIDAEEVAETLRKFQNLETRIKEEA